MCVNRQNAEEELVHDGRRKHITETANETKARSGAACRGSHERHSCRSMAVEVGFEPTEGLPLHTLSRRAPSATRRLHRRRAYLSGARSGTCRRAVRAALAPAVTGRAVAAA
jgi:hypothetical protein